MRGGDGVVVEVNSETDFVARNEEFQALVKTIALVAVEKGAADVEELKKQHYPGDAGTVADAISNAIATIGENMTLRRAASLGVPHGVIGHYVHNSIGEGLGKIGVIVALESTGDKDQLADLGRKIAMHVAAANPLALDAAGLDLAAVEREKNVLREKNAGKPAHVLDKIVESGLKTYYKEVTLLEQPYIHDNAKTVAQAVAEAAKTVGAPVALKGFVRYRPRRGRRKAGSGFRRRSRRGRRPGLIAGDPRSRKRRPSRPPFSWIPGRRGSGNDEADRMTCFGSALESACVRPRRGRRDRHSAGSISRWREKSPPIDRIGAHERSRELPRHLAETA